MRIQRKAFQMSIALACLLTFAGCKEITTTTRIHPDGSCERAVEVRTDLSSVENVFSETFPTPVDSTWNFEQTKDTANTGVEKFIYTAKKHFSRVSDLDRLFKSVSDTAYHVEIDARFEKRFRWFSTFFEYRETYKTCNPFTAAPISDFVTPRELSLYYLKEDTFGIDKKIDQWLVRNFFEDFYAALIRSAQMIPDSTLTPEIIQIRKDSLYAAIQLLDKQKSDNLNDVQKMILFLEKFYQTQAVHQWSVPLEKAMKDIERKQEFLMNLDGNKYVNQVVMPGLILDSNASSIEGSKALWKPEGKRFFWEDYTMSVESRVINRWAMWATGGVLLVMAGLVFIRIRR